MYKTIGLIFIYTILMLSGSAQTLNTTAPVKWQNYKVSEREVSILFPKLPIFIEESNYCSEFTVETYVAYANKSAYEMSVVTKNTDKNLDNCSLIKRFNQTTFEARIAEAKAKFADSAEQKLTLNGNKVTKVSKLRGNIWFVDDLKNGRWVKLTVTSYLDVNENEEKFVNSLNFTKKPQGIEIGDGATVTLGDEDIEEKVSKPLENDRTSKPQTTSPLMIIAKPRARYTDAARKKLVEGTVTLRVTFLPNGSIGSVSVVSRLSHGLTEQSIAAVRGIVFLPQNIEGKNVPVTKMVQYVFSIY